MSAELKSVGELFKAKRQELNVSLKEAENATSIRSSYLEAIEEGEIDQYISGVYALGFMKQYAQFLGVDIEHMIRQNPQAFHMPAEKHEFSYGIGTLGMIVWVGELNGYLICYGLVLLHLYWLLHGI